VFHCTHNNSVCHTGLLTACEQDQDGTVLILLASCNVTCVTYIVALCQWKTPDDEQRNCPKHVEVYSKNKFEKLVHLVGFIMRSKEFICNLLPSFSPCHPRPPFLLFFFWGLLSHSFCPPLYCIVSYRGSISLTNGRICYTGDLWLAAWLYWARYAMTVKRNCMTRSRNYFSMKTQQYVLFVLSLPTCSDQQCCIEKIRMSFLCSPV